MSLGSCADEDYSEKYSDPSKTTTASVSKLFTGVMYAGREYTFNSYWRMYTWDNGVLGKYAQTIGFTNSEGARWSAQDSYANNRWENFYNVLEQYRVLENVFESESAEDQSSDKIFKNLSEVFLYDHMSQLIDTFGDVPFSTAGFLAITGDVAGSYPSYDGQVDLYRNMLSRLGALYNEIKGANLDAKAAASLPKQDFLMNGDLKAWAKYANSLRLRLAVRVASQGALVAEGKAAISECMSRDVVETTDENIVALADKDGFNYEENFRDGYKDHSRASQAMLDILLTESTLGVNDPRLEVMYSKNAAGEYKGLSTSETLDEQTRNTALPEKDRVYSRIDSCLFYMNKNFISPIMTASEVHFLKAEAIQKGWANGDAESEFTKGVVESVNFYFLQNLKSASSYGHKATSTPSESTVADYAKKVWAASNDKENTILTQKWLNFGYFQQLQAWNDIRRTGCPKHLVFDADEQAQLVKTVPNRVRYPASERTANGVKYQEQVSKMSNGDDYYTKIFWAK